VASGSFNMPEISTVRMKPVTFTYSNYGLWNANLTANEYIICSQINYQVEGGVSNAGAVSHTYRIAGKSSQGGSWTDIQPSSSPLTIYCAVISVR